MVKLFKLILLHIFSIILSICPVLIYFLINLDKYTKTQVETVKLTVGGILLLLIVILKVLGKLKIPSGITLYGIVLVLAYLLDSIIDDIIVFAFWALIGEILSTICTAVIKSQRKKLEREKTAAITVNEIKKVIGGSGRV